jgi:hypothetical protein
MLHHFTDLYLFFPELKHEQVIVKKIHQTHLQTMLQLIGKLCECVLDSGSTPPWAIIFSEFILKLTD